MLRAKQLGLLFLVAVLWVSLRGAAGAQVLPTLTSSFFEAECNISHKTQLSSCPGDPSEFLPGTKCYSCSIGDGKPGDCLAYCDGEDGRDCHCEAEEVCPAGSVVSGGGCELHSSGDSVAQLTETSPSASGWECSWRHEEGSLNVDAYVSCVGITSSNP
jgi:hypothetical protein